MNIKAVNAQARSYAVRRAKRHNIWAIVAVIALGAVLVVKGQTTEHEAKLPARHFTHETIR